jgi:hypothetical protein
VVEGVTGRRSVVAQLRAHFAGSIGGRNLDAGAMVDIGAPSLANPPISLVRPLMVGEVKRRRNEHEEERE